MKMHFEYGQLYLVLNKLQFYDILTLFIKLVPKSHPRISPPRHLVLGQLNIVKPEYLHNDNLSKYETSH